MYREKESVRKRLLNSFKKNLGYLTESFLNLLDTLVVLRIGMVKQSHIGHLLFDSEIKLLKSKTTKLSKTFDVWYLTGKPCNHLVRRKLQQNMRFTTNPIFRWIFIVIHSNFPNSRHLLNIEVGVGDGDEIDNNPAIIDIKRTESKRAENILTDLKFDLGNKGLIIFCLRDSAYDLANRRLVDHEIHNDRNVNIDSYVGIVSELISQGYSVARMGRIANTPIDINHPQFLDLPFSLIRFKRNYSKREIEILELYLFACSSVVFSSGTGMDAFATALRKPLFLLDFTSITHVYSSKLFMGILPRSFREAQSGKLMTPDAVLQSSDLTVDSGRKGIGTSILLDPCTEKDISQFVDNALKVVLHKKQFQFCRDFELKRKEVMLRQGFKGAKIPNISIFWSNFEVEKNA